MNTTIIYNAFSLERLAVLLLVGGSTRAAARDITTTAVI
jgi:hypothetical protein